MAVNTESGLCFCVRAWDFDVHVCVSSPLSLCMTQPGGGLSFLFFPPPRINERFALFVLFLEYCYVRCSVSSEDS